MQSLPARLVTGRTVLERFLGITVPAELQPFVTALGQEQTKLETAYQATSQAEQRRDSALRAIGAADSELDASLEGLAISLVASRLGDRKKPFASFTSFTMTQLVKMACAKEVQAVEQMAAKITAANPPEPVAAAVGACLQSAAKVKTSLSAFSVPDAAYTTKLTERNALVADWERAYAKLERRAQVAWEDQPGMLLAVFARPESIQAPVTKRKKKSQTGKRD
jgi:hypothetical protein